jgi:Rel/ankyrin family protein
MLQIILRNIDPQVVGYKGRAVVVVSCVTVDTPYRPHPHNLVGKEGCKKGVCTIEMDPETMTWCRFYESV